MASLDLGTFKLIIKRALYHKELLTDELLQKFRKPLSTIEGRKAFLHFAHCLNNHDLLETEAELRLLDIPVLVILLMAENDMLAERAEDSLLLGLIGEKVSQCRDAEQRDGIALEQATVLKDLAAGFCLELRPDAAAIVDAFVGAYASHSANTPHQFFSPAASGNHQFVCIRLAPAPTVTVVVE